MGKKENQIFSFFSPSLSFFLPFQVFYGSLKQLEKYEEWDKKVENHRILGFEESSQTFRPAPSIQTTLRLD